MSMKKYFFMLLILIATTAVFSIPVDRPPDINDVTIEITQQNDFICPVVIDEPIVLVTETINQTKEMPAILASTESKRDVQNGKATTTHLKKSGTERYLATVSNYNIKTVADEITLGIESEELKPSIS